MIKQIINEQRVLGKCNQGSKVIDYLNKRNYNKLIITSMVTNAFSVVSVSFL